MKNGVKVTILAGTTLVLTLTAGWGADWAGQLKANGGRLVFPAGRHEFAETLTVDLKKLGAVSISADGPVTIVMKGAGPAFRIVGTHEGTADPGSFKKESWRERMPLIDGIEIVGAHREADGIELKGTMQAILTRVVIRKARHGIHLVERNRNVIIDACHVYENSGVGIFLDDVNLHQINIGDSHVSYNREGGIVVRNGNVRNLHIGNCDIEGNMPGVTLDPEAPDGAGVLDEAGGMRAKAANILIDVTEGTGEGESYGTHSVAEVAIAGCTIQHSSKTPHGANIRILGREEYPVNVVSIGNNVMSDTAVNLEMDWVKAVAVTGNSFFTSVPLDVKVTNAERVVFSGNVFDPRHARPNTVGGILFEDSTDCVLSATSIADFRDSKGAIQLRRCERFILSGCSVRDCANGIVIRECEDGVVSSCIVSGIGESGVDLDVDREGTVCLEGNRFLGRTRVGGQTGD